MRKFLLFISLLIVAAAARAGVIEPAKAITKFPAVISKPGAYVLAQNLVLKGTSGDAITVNADDVVIDLNDHTLTNEPPAGGNPTGAYCIYSFNHNNLTVRNGTIAGFYDGVYTSSGTDPGVTQVEKVTFYNCSEAGLNVAGDVEEVRDCRAESCGVFGLVVDSANYATMIGNEAFNTTGGSQGPGSGRGIQAEAIYSCTMIGNQAINPTQGFLGIAIFCSSGYSFARDNVVSGWEFGLDFANGSAGKYLNNLTDNCTTPFSGGTPTTGNN